MSALSRNKGAAGERELARILSDELGLGVTRNLLQTREGGHDLDGVPGWVIEVKRRAKVTEAEKREWWGQVVLAAGEFAQRGKPAVAYRADRCGWRFIVPLCVVQEYAGGVLDVALYEWTAEISLAAFCQLVRESLPVAA